MSQVIDPLVPSYDQIMSSWNVFMSRIKFNRRIENRAKTTGNPFRYRVKKLIRSLSCDTGIDQGHVFFSSRPEEPAKHAFTRTKKIMLIREMLSSPALQGMPNLYYFTVLLPNSVRQLSVFFLIHRPFGQNVSNATVRAIGTSY